MNTPIFAKKNESFHFHDSEVFELRTNILDNKSRSYFSFQFVRLKQINLRKKGYMTLQGQGSKSQVKVKR